MPFATADGDYEPTGSVKQAAEKYAPEDLRENPSLPQLATAALDAGYVWLVVIAVLNSLVSVAYYLGVLIPMYMGDDERTLVPPTARPWLLGTVLVAVMVTLLVGIDLVNPLRGDEHPLAVRRRQPREQLLGERLVQAGDQNRGAADAFVSHGMR